MEGYPIHEPFHSDRLKVSDIHDVYFEQVGKPDGTPIVFLHGGPGGGISPKHRMFFDPRFFRVILIDQRGCGKSTPYGELKENTTWDLVSDLEKIRENLKIPQWHVFGGSWGSTLALAYATRHPEKCLSLILRGIFLLRHDEVQWFYQSGASYIFPEEFELYKAPIPVNERHDLIKAYYARLTGSDQRVQETCAKSWARWETATWKLLPDSQDIASSDDLSFAKAFARIECHYFYNKGFFESDNFLIENADCLRKIPTRILHGRYDVVCPVTAAVDLKKAMPHAKLEILPAAGHSAFCPEVFKSLIRYTDELKPA